MRFKSALLVIAAALVLASPRRATASAPTEEDPALAPEVYRISPGDTIAIFVAERSDLSANVLIPLEGRVVLPGVGAVRAAGRGVEELSGEIARRLANEARLVDPRVAVSVVRYGTRRAFVYGAVSSSRAVDLPPEHPLTLTQAIATCGGFRVGADREHVRVTRRTGKAPPRVFEVNAQKIAEGASPELDPVLQSGDTVYVPPREPVYVLGQVGRPGALAVPYGYPLTVSKAVALSGGFSKFARYTRVRVTRRSESGMKLTTVDLGAVLDGKLDRDMELRPGDTVYVPERIF